MICGGSPCQDFSVAGKQAGSRWVCQDCKDENGDPYSYNPLTVHYSVRDRCPHCGSKNIDKTRSSLLVEWLRVIRANKPVWGIYENVKNIVGKKFKDTFNMFVQELHEYGYSTYYKVLNAKDYGIPQNRERVYLIIILKEYDNGKFVFPEGFDNGIRLKDILEDEVDEKYYISDEKVKKFLDNFNYIDAFNSEHPTLKIEGNNYNQRCVVHTSNDYCRTIIGAGGHGGYHAGNEPKVIVTQKNNAVKQIGNIVNTGNWKNPQRGRIYSIDGCSPALNCVGGGGQEPKIIQSAILSNKAERFEKISDVANTILARDYKGFGNQGMTGVIEMFPIRIRKLTPKECFRLQGFSDSSFEAASKVCSNSQLYKQAGNSIVVDVLYYIFVELYKAMPYLFDDLKLSSFFSGIGAFECGLDRLYESINAGNFTNPQVE